MSVACTVLPTRAVSLDLSLRALRHVSVAREAPLADARERGTIGLALDRDGLTDLARAGRALVEQFPLPGRIPVDLELTAFSPIAEGARFVVVDSSTAASPGSFGPSARSSVSVLARTIWPTRTRRRFGYGAASWPRRVPTDPCVTATRPSNRPTNGSRR
jgi:hypothetical protein